METNTENEKWIESGKWEINETNYAVQIAKKYIGAIAVLCEVPIYPNSHMGNVRSTANKVLKAVNEYDNLKAINEVLVNALRHIRQATNNSTIVILANEALELAQQ